MRYAMAAQAVTSTREFLKSVTQVDCISTQPGNRIITWSGRKPGIFKNVYYPLEYQYLIDNHQYSLLLADGSFFQFFYEFDHEDILTKARLAYYPRPISTSDTLETLVTAADEALDRDDEALYEHIFNWVEYMEIQKKSPSNTSHVRFDYDSEVNSHAPSHIQFSGMQELRVPAEFYPLPLTFIELCLPMLTLDHALDIGAINFECRSRHVLERPSGSIFLTSLAP